MSEEELQVTPASEFRKMRERGVALTLYSGRAVRLRGVEPSHFIRDPEFKAGTWPTIFTQLLMNMFWNGSYRTHVDEFLKPRTDAQESAEVAAALGVVAKKVLLSPLVVDVPQSDDEDEEVALSDLRTDELVLIFRLAFESHQLLYYLEANGLDSDNEDYEQAGPLKEA